jgi:hypothetical protein
MQQQGHPYCRPQERSPFLQFQLAFEIFGALDGQAGFALPDSQPTTLTAFCEAPNPYGQKIETVEKTVSCPFRA